MARTKKMTPHRVVCKVDKRYDGGCGDGFISSSVLDGKSKRSSRKSKRILWARTKISQFLANHR